MKKVWIVLFAVLMVFTVAMADFDLGDLPPCNYPTLYGNPAHSMSGKAWLGECITQEDDPYPVNGDFCDDGVVFVGLPWMPCEVETLIVTIHGGPNYGQVIGGLWLNAWKDGNLDGDFCDTLCEGRADEWIIHNVHYEVNELAPNTSLVDTFLVIDPGVTDMGIYAGVFRFRLTGRSLGRNGFGAWAPFDCGFDSPACGNFGADSLGEVEDYWLPDAQLQVELNGFHAIPNDSRVTLNWSTASETSNDRFEILRNDVVVHAVRAAGNTATGHSYSWTDESLLNGTPYVYTLVAVDMANQRQVLETIEATPSAGNALVTEYSLHQNFPNPFNPETQIAYDLVEGGNVTLTVYNMMGQKVTTLVSGMESAGHHTVNFNAATLPSGLYLYRIEANGFSDEKKMLLMK